MVGIVVVSHSERAAEGISEIAAEMAGDTRIEPVGGDGQGGIGTVPDAIEAATRAATRATSTRSSSSSTSAAR